MRRRHNERQFLYMLQGGDPDEWPEYQGPEDGQETSEDLIAKIEADLAASPFITHVDNRPESVRAAEAAAKAAEASED